jgi:hypothetical protein
MTSTPVILLLLRSGQSSDRPSGITIQAGQLALDFGAADPGLYFEDSAGSIAKIGPPSYGATAPNSTPVGLAGNYPGELWTDTSTGSGFLRVWNGASFANMNVAFATNAGTAIQTSSSPIASGAVLASGSLGSVLASGALGAISASGAILASGSLGAVLASGALSALVASGSVGGSVFASGSAGAVLASGALGSITASGTPIASGALGTVLASGALGSVLASGALVASGVGAGAGISISGLPASSATPSGALIYNAIPSGTQGSGLYVRVYTDWVKLF